jgi:hypothetical protein
MTSVNEERPAPAADFRFAEHVFNGSLAIQGKRPSGTTAVTA